MGSSSEKIPCVYIGVAPHRLSADHGPHHDGDSKPLTSLDILPGTTLMMSEEEVNGVTFWHDPRGILPSQKLGAGRVVKKEHEGLDLETLMLLGYDFHDGRSDFITVEQSRQQQTTVDATPTVATDTAEPTAATIIPLPPTPPPSPVSPIPTPVRTWNTLPTQADTSATETSQKYEVQ